MRIQAKQTSKNSRKNQRDYRWYTKRYSGKQGAKGLPKHIISEYKRLNRRK